MLTLLLLALSPALAQMVPGNLGEPGVVGLSTHDDGVHWGWYGTPWPDGFQMTRGTSVPQPSLVDRYGASDFPARARKAIKAPSENGKLYVLTRCPAGVRCGVVVGYLRLEKAGGVLHWYLPASISEGRIGLDEGQELTFRVQAAPPETGVFRYLRRRRK